MSGFHDKDSGSPSMTRRSSSSVSTNMPPDSHVISPPMSPHPRLDQPPVARTGSAFGASRMRSHPLSPVQTTRNAFGEQGVRPSYPSGEHIRSFSGEQAARHATGDQSARNAFGEPTLESLASALTDSLGGVEVPGPLTSGFSTSSYPEYPAYPAYPAYPSRSELPEHLHHLPYPAYPAYPAYPPYPGAYAPPPEPPVMLEAPIPIPASSGIWQPSQTPRGRNREPAGIPTTRRNEMSSPPSQPQNGGRRTGA